MSDLSRGPGISPLELPKYVPGAVWLEAVDRSWKGISARGYRYHPSEISAPPLSDFVLVSYQSGTTRMTRRAGGGPRQSCQIRPNQISLLTCSMESEWTWDSPIDVFHIYIKPFLIEEVARNVFSRNIHDLQLYDLLNVDDASIHVIVQEILKETQADAIGSRLYIESLSNQLCIHLLRNYFDFEVPHQLPVRQFDDAIENRVRDFILSHLCEDLSLDALAEIAGISPSHFGRVFRQSFGTPPHRFVLNARLAEASRLLSKRANTIAEIAVITGFADQGHLTRRFRERFGVTPRRWQRG